MITPVNGHILIDPVEKSSFIQSERGKYQEIGVVVAIPLDWSSSSFMPEAKIGDKVYFDSWLAAKYPKGVSEADGFYWLVEWKNVRAVEYGE